MSKSFLKNFRSLRGSSSALNAVEGAGEPPPQAAPQSGTLRRFRPSSTADAEEEVANRIKALEQLESSLKKISKAGKDFQLHGEGLSLLPCLSSLCRVLRSDVSRFARRG